MKDKVRRQGNDNKVINDEGMGGKKRKLVIGGGWGGGGRRNRGGGWVIRECKEMRM